MISIPCQSQDGAVLPVYQTEGAAGADVCAFVPETVILKPGQRYLVSTGLRFAIPKGYEIQVRPRSGLALKHGITCLNSPGTIDSDYRGEVGVILINHGTEDFEIHNGDRIVQLVVAPVLQGKFYCVDSLDDTQRGNQGFGSTGK